MSFFSDGIKIRLWLEPMIALYRSWFILGLVIFQVFHQTNKLRYDIVIQSYDRVILSSNPYATKVLKLCKTGVSSHDHMVQSCFQGMIVGRCCLILLQLIPAYVVLPLKSWSHGMIMTSSHDHWTFYPRDFFLRHH